MTIKMKIPTYIEWIQDTNIYIRVNDRYSKRMIRNLGAHKVFLKRLWKISLVDKKDITRILCTLRDNNIAFSSGREWPPSEIFEELREKNLLRGKYTKIYWSSPRCWHLQEC